MSVIWFKVWSDLWHNKVRTGLAILSIAVGVFAVGAIFGMVDQLISTMDQAHQDSSPSHINMFLERYIDEEIADRLENIDGVVEIELQNSMSVQFKVHPDDDWRPAAFAMRQDYDEQIYDVFTLKEGVWPEDNKISIERLSSEHFGIEVGDTVIFDMEGTDRVWEVSGKVRHPFVEPPQFGGDAVFILDGRGMERFDVPDGQFGNLRISVEPYSADFAKDVASEIKTRLAKEDIAVAITFFQDPTEHWGRLFIEGFNLVLQILAIVSLFMSVVLVTNTLTALITQQTDQIGVIKAIGGTRSVIIKTYLTGVLIYGAVSLLIALPLGAIVAFGMSQWFLNIFNIDHEVFEISQRAITLQVIAAIGVPILAGLWPILSGAAITVREAIASYGLGRGNFGGSRLDRWVEWVGAKVFSGPYAMALGNMFRRKGRLSLTQLVLISAGAMFLLVMSLSASLVFTLDNDIARRGYDIHITFSDSQRVDRATKIAEAMNGVIATEMWFSQAASILKEGQRMRESGVGAELYGLPPGSDMYTPLISHGRWLQPGDDRVVVVSQDLSIDHDINVGDVITLDLAEMGDAEWQVIGITPIIISDGFATDPIYAPLNAVYDVTKKHNKGTRLQIRTSVTDLEEIASLDTQLRTTYEDRDMEIDIFVSGTTPQDRVDALNQFGIVTTMMSGLAIIVALVGGIGLMGSLSISVVERTREIGVMRAVGAKSRTILGMFIMEGVMQGLLSWAIAVPISFLLTKPVAERLGETMLDVTLDFEYSLMGVVIWLVIVLVISIGASVLPARSATKISVRESLAYG